MNCELSTSVQYLKGVGPVRAGLLNSLSIFTVRDLLYYFPNDWEDRSRIRNLSEIVPGEKTVVRGIIRKAREKKISLRLGILEILISDKTGFLTLSIFKATNRKYDVFESMKKRYIPGITVLAYGLPEIFGSELKLNVQEIEEYSENTPSVSMSRIVPVYNLTKGLDAAFYRKIVFSAVKALSGQVRETLPSKILKDRGFSPASWAVENIHFPESYQAKDEAYRRLVFEEFFYYEMALLVSKKSVEKTVKKHSYELKKTLLSGFREKLGFEFTTGQKKAINEIFADMQKPGPMNRLLQGDVGSGKTVVALSAMLLAAENGAQSVLLAPTEILAAQHFRTFRKLLSGLPLNFELLLGGTKKKEREVILKNIREGKTDILVGTHAVIEEDIKFKKLCLAVIDEQHKFGVHQRLKLIAKGDSPDVLIMTATPIPRTLAMTAYGDLDLSTIDNMPFERRIHTLYLPENEAYSFLAEKLHNLKQAYVVYPLIEESEKIRARSCKVMYDKISKELLPGYRVEMLHGRMKGEEKERIVSGFRDKTINVLVSTSVVEVGIDVPDASLLLIGNSERHGLTTLHQIRGRIGRKGQEAFCILTGFPSSDEARKRIRIMQRTADGFVIAEEDLAMRGPGEILGINQSGLPDLKIGSLIMDRNIISEARKSAKEMLISDWKLETSENAGVKKELLSRFGNKLKFIFVG